MQALDEAVVGLEQVLVSPAALTSSWRRLVRQRIRGVDDALTAERTRAGDTWLNARAGHLQREKDRLLTRVREMGLRVKDGSDVEPIRSDLRRLVVDIQHHRQRVSDLTYDAVAMDVGGSE